MTNRLLWAVALVSFVACGGSAKQRETAPLDDMEATPVEPAATEPAETEPAAEPAATAAEGEGGVCPTLCDRILACAMEMSKQEPTEEQLAQAQDQCTAQCAQEAADKLEAAGKCVADNPDSCPGLFECLEPLQSES